MSSAIYTARTFSPQPRDNGALIAPPVDKQPRTRIRQRIKRLLEDRGMTQGTFAREVGHGDQWASNLLTGAFTLTMDDLDRVAKVLHVPPGEIVRVSEEPWELTPTEMRVIRALRMLPPPVRDAWAMMTDFLIGATPEEADHLVVLRELSEKNQRTLKRWAQALRRQQALGLDEADPPDLPGTVEPPRAQSPRTRGARKR